MQRVQHFRRVFEALGAFEVLENELLVLECTFACRPTLNENAAKLRVVRLGLKRVNDWQGVFPLVEVFAETFLLGILFVI